MSISEMLAREIAVALAESNNDISYSTFDSDGKPAETIGPDIIAACVPAVDKDFINELLATGLPPLNSPFNFSEAVIEIAKSEGFDIPAEKISFAEALAVTRDFSV